MLVMYRSQSNAVGLIYRESRRITLFARSTRLARSTRKSAVGEVVRESDTSSINES